MPDVVPGLASVHIDGLIHGVVREGLGISNKGETVVYETFCGNVRVREWLDMSTMKHGNQKEWPTCIGCIVLP